MDKTSDYSNKHSILEAWDNLDVLAEIEINHVLQLQAVLMRIDDDRVLITEQLIAIRADLWSKAQQVSSYNLNKILLEVDSEETDIQEQALVLSSLMRDLILQAEEAKDTTFESFEVKEKMISDMSKYIQTMKRVELHLTLLRARSLFPEDEHVSEDDRAVIDIARANGSVLIPINAHDGQNNGNNEDNEENENNEDDEDDENNGNNDFIGDDEDLDFALALSLSLQYLP